MNPTDLARTEILAVLSTLIFLICPFLFFLFSPKGQNAHHSVSPLQSSSFC